MMGRIIHISSQAYLVPFGSNGEYELHGKGCVLYGEEDSYGTHIAGRDFSLHIGDIISGYVVKDILDGGRYPIVVLIKTY